MDCVLSSLETVKKMKRTGGVLGQNGNANPQHALAPSRTGKVVGKLKMLGFKDFF